LPGWSYDDKLRAMKRYAAEIFGTFCLVFAGTGAIVVNDVSRGAITQVGIALTFGLVVMTMIYAIGDVSGAHLNPAVTLGFFAARRLPARELVPYVLSECGGAIAASLTLRVMFPHHSTLGATLPADGFVGASFVLEAILTCILMFVILSVSTSSHKALTGIAVGGVIALEALFAGPICGASMNPARSLAPALVSGHLSYLWVYLTATPLGALIAVSLCRNVCSAACCPRIAWSKS
jgi:aquaporin Z